VEALEGQCVLTDTSDGIMHVCVRVFTLKLCVSSYAINFRSSRKNFARRNEHRGKSHFKAQRAKLELGVLSVHALGIFDVKFALPDPNGDTSAAGSWLQQ
jgi:hypothetical protein